MGFSIYDFTDVSNILDGYQCASNNVMYLEHKIKNIKSEYKKLKGYELQLKTIKADLEIYQEQLTMLSAHIREQRQKRIDKFLGK